MVKNSGTTISLSLDENNKITGWTSHITPDSEYVIACNPNDIIVGVSRYIDGQLFIGTEEEIIEYQNEIKKNTLRQERKPLLAAFDIWEKNVLRGREEEDSQIMEWYQKVLTLDEEAISSPPEKIIYYL